MSATRTQVHPTERRRRRLVPPSGRVCFSTVKRCEPFAGKHVDEDVVRRLLAPFGEVPVDREVAERAGRIRRGAGVGTPDTIIAACALGNGLTLGTPNARGFAGIAGLRVHAPRG